MFEEKLSRFTPFAIGILLAVIGAIYFLTPLRHLGSGIFSFTLVTCIAFSFVYYFNEFITHKKSNYKKPNSYSFIRDKKLSIQRDKQLKKDVSSLKLIVGDMKMAVYDEEAKYDFTLYLRPICEFGNKSPCVYEALYEASVKHSLNETVRFNLILSKSISVLKKLKLTMPHLKILINVSQNHIKTLAISNDMEKYQPFFQDIIINIEDIHSLDFTVDFKADLKKLAAKGFSFAMTEPAPLLTLTRMKTLVDLSEMNVHYLRGSYSNFMRESVLPIDFKRIYAAGISFILDNISLESELLSLSPYGFILTEGEFIGIPRPVKTDFRDETL
jgi:hypothetical protein